MLHEALLLLRGQQEEAALFLEALSFECHIKCKSNSEDVCLTLLFGETAENGKQQIAPSSPMMDGLCWRRYGSQWCGCGK